MKEWSVILEVVLLAWSYSQWNFCHLFPFLKRTLGRNGSEDEICRYHSLLFSARTQEFLLIYCVISIYVSCSKMRFPSSWFQSHVSRDRFSFKLTFGITNLSRTIPVTQNTVTTNLHSAELRFSLNGFRAV